MIIGDEGAGRLRLSNGHIIERYAWREYVESIRKADPWPRLYPNDAAWLVEYIDEKFEALHDEMRRARGQDALRRAEHDIASGTLHRYPDPPAPSRYGGVDV